MVGLCERPASELFDAIELGESDCRLGEAHVRILPDTRSLGAPITDERMMEERAHLARTAPFPPHEPQERAGRMPYRRVARVSVTELMTLAKCPRKFYLERFFPLDDIGFSSNEAQQDAPIADRSNGLGIVAHSIGTLTHKIMELHEQDMLAWDPSGDPPEAIVEAVSAYVADPPADSRISKEDIVSASLNHLRNIVTGGVLKAQGSEKDGTAIRALKEIPFELPAGELIVVGAIDRLTQSPDGSWSVWDYKTTRLNGRSKEETAKEEAYDLQLKLYAWAAADILGTAPTKAAIVFSVDPDDPLFYVPVDKNAVNTAIGAVLSNAARIVDEGLESYPAIKKEGVCANCSCAGLELC